ncbi:hypothetical protein [Streptomyces sp. XD-27]|uniref:hypothetical protein n=1 Tax=Streptomyces sp. XD-27 TaxID=3062779 RepID=UPI0026F411F4|nr:hypothetical protein [Streptomyces sp. XD-27]WKX72288.1 hypothetical protein Q3Y56_22430 [Streptomyces sp. XD-27]
MSVVGTNALGLLMGNAELPMPVLTGRSGRFLVGHLITLLPAVMLLYGMGRGDLRAESVACRPVRASDAVLGLAVAIGGAAVAGLNYAIGSGAISLVLGRNIAAYVGLGLLLLPLLGHRLAAVVLAAVPLVCAVTGWGPGGKAEPWAWILHPADSPVASVITAVVLFAGLSLTVAMRPSSRAIAWGV